MFDTSSITWDSRIKVFLLSLLFTYFVFQFIVFCRYPLMCLLDYLGHRLIAMSVLPISGSGEGSTLVYGTQDGGKNYKFTDPVAMEYAKKIGKKLNLKEHKLSSPLVDHGIYTPADIEIHKGKDNNYYILDFSRLLPCDQINKHKPGSIFYR